MAEKILIVDDDLDTLRLVGLMLQHQGYRINAASSGIQAISIVQTDNSSGYYDARDGWL
jgi:pilus assembly protein CpaE